MAFRTASELPKDSLLFKKFNATSTTRVSGSQTNTWPPKAPINKKPAPAPKPKQLFIVVSAADFDTIKKMRALRVSTTYENEANVCRKKIGRILDSYGWKQGVQIIRSNKTTDETMASK